MKPLFRMVICALLLSAGLTSCSSMTPTAAKRAYCNMLKSSMVFSGSTSNTREANIQASEEPLQQRTYDRENCEE
ncbi:hypothetical protein AQUSIP_20320 [Aquicella siphonis]|uniref:Lipoprotein n=1 Tax=Aquicella siphonis TaxID=254247 RepID=A0A5E4PJU6_9COXI|nr:hypothetical protein [Aquicella siphonis]VVC76707.1 hypothetical protein AQUSIP_20320 [Aquicella siphonis]